MIKPELTQHTIDRLRQETHYLHARSSTIAVPLFVMQLVLDAAEETIKNSKFKIQNDGEPKNERINP